MEGITKNIHIVGNPGIDHLLKNIKKIDLNKNKLIKNRILITMHRRESLDKNLELFVKNLKNSYIITQNFQWFGHYIQILIY